MTSSVSLQNGSLGGLQFTVSAQCPQRDRPENCRSRKESAAAAQRTNGDDSSLSTQAPPVHAAVYYSVRTCELCFAASRQLHHADFGFGLPVELPVPCA